MASSHSSGGDGQHRDSATPGVSSVGNAVSDTIMMVGDAMGTAVHAAGNVGEEVVLTAGRLGRAVIGEVGGLLTDLVGNLRSTVSAGVRGHDQAAAGTRSAPGETHKS